MIEHYKKEETFMDKFIYWTCVVVLLEAVVCLGICIWRLFLNVKTII